jgi:hypothetical protein
MIGQIDERETPGLVLNVPLGRVAMEVEFPKVAEDLRNSISRVLEARLL